MKNLKVSMKLIISFLVVIVLSVIVGAVGIYGMYSMNVADDQLYNGNYLPTVLAGHISQNIVEQRVYIRNFVVYDVVNDANDFKSAETKLDSVKKTMQGYLADYKLTITNSEDQRAFDELLSIYNNEWLPMVDNIRSLGAANDAESAKDLLVSAASIADKLDAQSKKLQDVNLSDGEKMVNGNTQLFISMAVVECIVLAVSVGIAMILAFYISSLISKPVGFMKDVLLRIGTEGDLVFTDAEYRQIESYAAVKDEVGESVNMLLTTVRRLVKVGESLGTVASGDLTADLALLSDRDTMGLSLKKMVDNLNDMFGEIHNSTSQVSTGSKQIADGSQALAQGSTQQAAAVEELSSSISEIAEKTKENASMATHAANLANTIKRNAEKGNTQMNHMMEAVKDINQASQSINKVIKVIDDIAFQTNILALNAAVEAARAGQHGKGFAVVAEEVRNLAAKSAEAAKDTGGLIANSIEKAELGAQIAEETAASLVEIVTGINESSKIVGDIAESSSQQSLGISQINKGIDQVAQVIQQNSATAEESAAASQEMSSQANMLEDLIGQFKLKSDNGAHRRLAAPSPAPGRAKPAPQKQLVMPAKLSPASSGNDDGFGKY